MKREFNTPRPLQFMNVKEVYLALRGWRLYASTSGTLKCDKCRGSHPKVYLKDIPGTEFDNCYCEQHVMEDEDRKKPNREKARAPKRFWEWCPGCDRDRLTTGKKCRVCGTKLMQSREKK